MTVMMAQSKFEHAFMIH